MNVTTELRFVAGLIADQILRNGHYQGDTDTDGSLRIDYDAPANDRPCCVVAGHRFEENDDLMKELTALIVKQEGISCEKSVFSSKRGLVVQWNDAVSTDEVVDALRAIEVG